MEYDERREEAYGCREIRTRGAHMRRARRAVLLSGLVFPGLGQIYLKRYRPGVIIILLVVVGMILLISMAARDAFSVLKQWELQGAPIDFQDLLNVAVETSTGRSGSYMSALSFVVGCWLFSMLDACRAGKTKNLSDE